MAPPFELNSHCAVVGLLSPPPVAVTENFMLSPTQTVSSVRTGRLTFPETVIVAAVVVAVPQILVNTALY